MSREYYVVYDVASGAERWRGGGGDGATQMEAATLPEGLAVMQVPQAAIAGEALDYAAIQAFYSARIDASAEAYRLRFITPGSGQAMEYQEAVTQATAYGTDPGGTYPMLEADVTAGTIDVRTGQSVTTVAEAADLVLFMFGQWQAVGAAIRATRLGAKKAIQSAGENLTAIAAALDVTWPGA